METRPEKKWPCGRPIKNEIEPMPDTAENIAKAIFRTADKKIVRPK